MHCLRPLCSTWREFHWFKWFSEHFPPAAYLLQQEEVTYHRQSLFQSIKRLQYPNITVPSISTNRTICIVMFSVYIHSIPFFERIGVESSAICPPAWLFIYPCDSKSQSIWCLFRSHIVRICKHWSCQNTFGASPWNRLFDESWCWLLVFKH